MRLPPAQRLISRIGPKPWVAWPPLWVAMSSFACMPTQSRGHATRRPGLTLLEVLVALAIFLLSFAAIGQLVSLAGDRALDIQYQTEAMRLCQSQMAEVMWGSVPLQSQGDTTFDLAPEYTWSMDCEQGSVSGLWNVTVRVSRQRKGGSKLEVSLSQMIMDPAQRGSTLDLAAAASSGGSSGNGQGGQAQGGQQQQQQQQPAQQMQTPQAGAGARQGMGAQQGAGAGQAGGVRVPAGGGQGAGGNPGGGAGQQKGASSPLPKSGGAATPKGG